MKYKYVFTICFSVLLSTFVFAQDFSYGVMLGANIYQSDNNNGENQLITENNELVATTNLGAYIEYGFNNNMGVKLEASFNKKEVTRKHANVMYTFNFLELSPSFKYDFGNTYQQGFYMTIGPRISVLTKSESSINNEEPIKNVHLGAQLGLGHRVFKFIDLEGKFDYGLTPYFELNNGDKSKFFGVYLSALIDIQSLLKI